MDTYDHTPRSIGFRSTLIVWTRRAWCMTAAILIGFTLAVFTHQWYGVGCKVVRWFGGER